MTLIPLMSAIAVGPRRSAAPAASATPTPRGGYDPGAGHRPLAALLALGLPTALVVAVALSPMISVITQKSPPIVIDSIPAPKPPDPVVRPDTPPPPPPLNAVDPLVKTLPLAPIDLKPLPPIEIPLSTGGGGDVIAERPVAPPIPKLVIAQIDPRYADRFQPDYPAREQRRGIEGSVTVRVLIGTDGRVKAVEQVASESSGDGSGFFEATRRRALTQWRFKPATRGGVAEESWKVMTVKFQIRNG